MGHGRNTQVPFGENRVEVPKAKGLFLGLKDCAVYRSVSKGGATVSWEKTLDKPFYPLGVCSRSELKAEGEYVYAFLCVLGMGAGGGCSAGGNYRTLDGQTWEQEVHGRWIREEAPGLFPIYPGAVPIRGQGGATSLQAGKNYRSTIYLTESAPSEVIRFYEKNLKDYRRFHDPAGEVIFQMKGGSVRLQKSGTGTRIHAVEGPE